MSEGRAGLWLSASAPSTRLHWATGNISPLLMAKDNKAERLAAALRANLKRRKAQSREVQEKKEPSQPARE
jgi:hypothetical protein